LDSWIDGKGGGAERGAEWMAAFATLPPSFCFGEAGQCDMLDLVGFGSVNNFYGVTYRDLG